MGSVESVMVKFLNSVIASILSDSNLRFRI